MLPSSSSAEIETGMKKIGSNLVNRREGKEQRSATWSIDARRRQLRDREAGLRTEGMIRWGGA
jgi:hypothetical protein